MEESEGDGTPDRRQVDKSTVERGNPMADSHEERLRRMAIGLVETFHVLREALALLPIPIVVEVVGLSDSAELSQRMERVRDLIRDEPVPEGAVIHLDLAILAFLSAFDVTHIAQHAEEIAWREDATFVLLKQVAAYLAVVAFFLEEDDEESQED
ncbi:hypothetical protein [Nonomuraea dietziae]|uniref:hypothetical protein n=1 Tax=Nonomuraea dietziae TaxID=65515 RepID=UPI00342AA712